MLKYALKEDWKETTQNAKCTVDGGCGWNEICNNQAKYEWFGWFYCEKHFIERYGK